MSSRNEKALTSAREVEALAEGAGKLVSRSEQWRRMPRREVHPFELAMRERRMTLQQAAELLGWSKRTLQDVIAWRRPVPLPERKVLTTGLGYARPEDIFPDEPRELAPAPAPPGTLAKKTKGNGR